MNFIGCPMLQLWNKIWFSGNPRIFKDPSIPTIPNSVAYSFFLIISLLAKLLCDDHEAAFGEGMDINRGLCSVWNLWFCWEKFSCLDRTSKAKTKMNGDRGERKRDTTRAERRLALLDTFVVGFLSPTRAEWTTWGSRTQWIGVVPSVMMML